MLYKTIVLQMLEDRPQLRSRLQQYRQLLPTLEFYAEELRAGHETWKARLSQAKPRSDESQLASEALELALADLEARLPAESDSTGETDLLAETMMQPALPSSNE